MGQMVAVSEQPSATPGIVRFELNRTLTGMGHEHFTAANQAIGTRPAAVLARRFFDSGQVDGVHVYANVVTVELARGGTAEPLTEILRTLYRYWQPGMEPPTFDEPAAESPAEDAAAPTGEGEDPAYAAALKLVPAHLLERGRAARERWKAKQG